MVTVQLRLEEISRKLRTGDVVPPENERSPSPEPQYDRDGTRLNTREKRYRKKLEEERQQLIEQVGCFFFFFALCVFTLCCFS